MDDLMGGRRGPATPFSHQEARTYLLSVPVLAPALKVIDEKVEHFNNNYLILPNFINDTVDKLKSISDTAIQVLICNIPGDEEQLSSCIDNYVSGLAHHKVFGSVKSFCRNTDADLESFRIYKVHTRAALYRRLEFLRTSHVTAEALGVREEAFCCELPQAIVELASLDAKYTPVDKLWCLRSTLRSIQMEVEEHCHQSGVQIYYGEDMPVLTNEILILLVVLVMARSKPMYLASNIFYIDHFCGVKDDFSSFTISTFKAASEFVRNFNGNGLEEGLSPRMLKKELSLADLMEVTASINENSNNNNSSSSSSGSLAAEPKNKDENDKKGSHVQDSGNGQLLPPRKRYDEHSSQRKERQQSLSRPHFQQSLRQRTSLIRDNHLRSSLDCGSGAGAGRSEGASSFGVDRKLEEITRLIQQQTLDFHSKEEEHLRRLDNSYSSKSSIAGHSYGLSPSSSSLNSSFNKSICFSYASELFVAGPGYEAPNLLFSPLTSRRRSLRQQRNS
ncbi:uncharacterized protein LOC111246092 isoform X2 [Varroa destructor]|uniref:VPS9 domain-containing protein n=1 Tax=Varroa destructor TaxID=109461 RepID=A0A7M7JEN6_VARDE|nr:uncharacterized protein LOC111246092 isoform X2 [Varroa destructor]